MGAETESALTPPPAACEALTNEPPTDESLTDVIDQLDRRAFQRALERRHSASFYRTVIDSARLERTTSS